MLLFSMVLSMIIVLFPTFIIVNENTFPLILIITKTSVVVIWKTETRKPTQMARLASLSILVTYFKKTT